MTIAQHTPTCRHCSSPRPWSDRPCATCGAVALVPPAGTGRVSHAAPKTPGLAVLLSFLWFGAGHLYANRTATGVVLMVVDLIIFAIGMTGVGLVVAIPAWLVMAPIVMVLSAGATNDFNRRNGLLLR